jgi:hypothetical protein
VKSYLGNALHLLAHLAEENSSAFILRRLRASVALLAPFGALHRKMLSLVAGLFGSATSRTVRVQVLFHTAAPRCHSDARTCRPDARSCRSARLSRCPCTLPLSHVQPSDTHRAPLSCMRHSATIPAAGGAEPPHTGTAGPKYGPASPKLALHSKAMAMRSADRAGCSGRTQHMMLWMQPALRGGALG